MIVLALENGYIRIDSGDGEYWVETDNPGEAAPFDVSGKPCNINVEPIGSICIAQFEKSKDEYLRAGGNLADMLSAFNRGGIIKLNPPYYPSDLLRSRALKALDLSDIPDLLRDSRPLKAFYIPDGNKLFPAFEVESIEELFFYDYMQLRARKYNLRYCEDCGSIFPAHTNAVRCKKCRAAGMGAKKKITNIKANKAREYLYQINNRNKSRDLKLMPPLYLTNISRAFAKHKNDTEYMLALNRMDQWLYSVYKYLKTEDEIELMAKLSNDFEMALCSSDPEKWLIEWMRNNGIYDTVLRSLPNKSKARLIQAIKGLDYPATNQTHQSRSHTDNSDCALS